MFPFAFEHDYISEGDENWEGEKEQFHIKGGIELGKNLFLVGGIGFSQIEGRLGTPYFMEDEYYLTYSAELRYATRWLNAGIGNHNKRGYFYSIGFLFPIN